MSATLIAIGTQGFIVRSYESPKGASPLRADHAAAGALNRLTYESSCELALTVLRGNGEYGAVFVPSIDPHTYDFQCTVDRRTRCCAACGIQHGDACLGCGGRAFHNPGCPETSVV